MTAFLANLESSGLYWLIVWGLTATAVWGGAAGAAFCLRRHSAQARHRIWALSMLATLAAPCLAPVIPVPRWWRWSEEPAAGRDILVESSARGVGRTATQSSDDRETAHSAPSSSIRRADAESNLTPLGVHGPRSQSVAEPSAVGRSEASDLSWRLAVVGVWLGGIGVSLLLFAAGLWKVHRLRNGSVIVSDGVETKLLGELCRRMNIRHPPQLLVSPQALVPFLAGVRRAAIVLPAGFGHWRPNRLEIVLTHELIHLACRDVIWEIVARLALVPAWFHPFGWFAIRRQRIERELACDDAVLLQGAPPADYAEQLVEVAAELHSRRWNPTPVVAIAGASPIERRIRSILDPRTWRAPLGRWRRIGLSVCMAGLVVVVAVLSPASGDEKAAPSKSPAKTPEQATSIASDADWQIAAALNRPTTIHLQNVSLDDALLALSATCGLPIAFYEESFADFGAEISPTVAVQANGEPLGSVLRSLAQSAIGGAKIGISVVAKDGALRISADGAVDRSLYRHSGGGDRVTTQRGAVRMSSDQPAGDCSIVIRMQSGILVLHADAEGRFSVPMPVSDRERLSVIARSADGSQIAAQEFPRPIWLRQEAAPIEVKLDRVKTISVLVSDGSGGPIPHAHAAVTEMKRGYWMFDRTPFWGDTDDSGKFTVRLPEKFQIGFVYAFKPGAGLDYRSYVAPRGNGDLHAKTPLQPDGLVRLTLAGSRRVTIKCIDESGNPVAGLLVAPRCFTFTKQNETDVLGPNPSYAVANDRGEAIFDWIPTWQQDVVHFEASPGRRLADGEQVKFDLNQSTDQFIVTIHRPVELSGTVRDVAGKPEAGAEIELHGRGYGQRRFEGHTKSDDRGRYQFEVPPLQVYMLAANSKDRREASAVRDGIAAYPQKPVAGSDLALVPTTRVFGQVTVGPNNKPAGHYQVRAASEEHGSKRTPNPDFPHGPEDYLGWPGITQFAETDAQGRFDIRLASGEYDFYADQPIANGGMLIDPDQKLHRRVTIGGEKELEVNLHGNSPMTSSVLHGTVVDGGKPVPGALIDGASQPGPRFNAVADDHGAFDISVPDAPAVVFAKSKDGSLAGVARAGVGERNITVPILATATCTVRLLHKDQKPYSSDRTVEYGVEIPIDPSNRRSAFREASGGKVHPDRDGRLLLPGMVVGETYKIRLQDVDSRYESRPLTTVRPQTPGDQSLPDIAFDPPPPYHRPTFKERLAETFERPMPAVQRNKEAKDFARLADAQVLVTFADPHAAVTKSLYKLYFEDEALPRIVNNNYLTLAIPTGAEKRAEAVALAKELGVELPGDGSPLIVAEGTDGKVLGVLTAAELVTNGKEINKDALSAFVKRHAPPALDARKLLDDALAQAKRENKRVLIQQTAVWCGPCDRLATFLDQNRQLWEKDYLWVRMDIRWTGQAEIVKSLRGEAQGGFPWLAILDADGKMLSTSNKPDDGRNIGFPSEPDAIDHFLHMLKTTAQRMTADDLARVKTTLEAAGREK